MRARVSRARQAPSAGPFSSAQFESRSASQATSAAPSCDLAFGSSEACSAAKALPRSASAASAAGSAQIAFSLARRRALAVERQRGRRRQSCEPEAGEDGARHRARVHSNVLQMRPPKTQPAVVR